MGPNVPIPVEALLRGPFPPGKSWWPLRVDVTELVMDRILRGAAFRLVPAQSGKEWFPKLQFSWTFASLAQLHFSWTVRAVA